MAERNRQASDLFQCRQSAIDFANKSAKFKRIQSEFADAKERFYNAMEEYFKRNNVDGKLCISDDSSDFGFVTINRVQSTKVEFDIAKLEKSLGKDISRKVIIKRYEISDIDGLVSYLKECGVDPKIFKSFLSISRSLDVKELDRLADIGEISRDQIEGCYSVKKQKPYFTVNVGKGQNDEEGK